MTDREREAEKAAEDARRAHESGPEHDSDATDAHTELTRPEHSKARPLPRRPGSSGGGNDGP